VFFLKSLFIKIERQGDRYKQAGPYIDIYIDNKIT